MRRRKTTPPMIMRMIVTIYVTGNGIINRDRSDARVREDNLNRGVLAPFSVGRRLGATARRMMVVM
jgi:hypothetical protein